MRRVKPDVEVALDFGSSLTKGIYRLQSTSTPHLLLMSPKVAETTAFGLQSAAPAVPVGNPPPETEAWVKLGETYYAIGQLAEQLHATAGLKALKWERALPKLLAALWVIQTRHRLRSRLKVSLSCLLPPGEYDDSYRLQQALQRLGQIETPTGSLQLKVLNVECYPESAGVLGLFTQHQAMPALVAFIMLGYRNASLLLLRHGKLSAMHSSNLGFVRCIERIQEHMSGLSPATLLPAIAEATRTGNAVPYVPIMPYSDPALREQSARQLVSLVAQAKAVYFQQLSQWLDESLPLSERPGLVFCGGTAETMQDALEQYQPHLLHIDANTLPLPSELETLSHDESSARLMDVCGMFASQFIQTTQLAS